MAEMDYFYDGWEPGQLTPQEKADMQQHYQNSAPSTNELNGIAPAGSNISVAGTGKSARKTTHKTATSKSKATSEFDQQWQQMSKLYHIDASIDDTPSTQTQTSTVVPYNQPVNFHGDADKMPWVAITIVLLFWLVVGIVLIRFIVWLGKKQDG